MDTLFYADHGQSRGANTSDVAITCNICDSGRFIAAHARLTNLIAIQTTPK